MKLKALRYLLSLKDATSSRLSSIIFRRCRGRGYNMLVEDPYCRDTRCYAPLNLAITRLDELRADWVQYIVTTKGRDVLLKLLTSAQVDEDELKVLVDIKVAERILDAAEF